MGIPDARSPDTGLSTLKQKILLVFMSEHSWGWKTICSCCFLNVCVWNTYSVHTQIQCCLYCLCKSEYSVRMSLQCPVNKMYDSGLKRTTCTQIKWISPGAQYLLQSKTSGRLLFPSAHLPSVYMTSWWRTAAFTRPFGIYHPAYTYNLPLYV